MSLSTKTLLPTRAQATNTTTVEADVAIPNNCHTIIIYNPDTTNEVYVDETGASGSPLSPTTSTRIKAGAYFTMTIGTKSTRVSQSNLVFGYSTSAGTFDVSISYICSNVV